MTATTLLPMTATTLLANSRRQCRKGRLQCQFTLGIWFEQLEHFLLVLTPERTLGDALIDQEIQVQEILGPVILIHPHIFQSDFCRYIALGEVFSQFNQLFAETLDEFLVYVGDPGLHADGHILVHQRHSRFLFKDLLQADDAGLVEPAEEVRASEGGLLVGRRTVDAATHQDAHGLVVALLALPEGEPSLHVHDHLLWHTDLYILKQSGPKSTEASKEKGRKGYGEKGLYFLVGFVAVSNLMKNQEISQQTDFSGVHRYPQYTHIWPSVESLILDHNQLIVPMQLLTTFTHFFRSRQKLLIKRRKIGLKNRPISSKRLKEEQQTLNISYQTKLVEIKKQLDRKKSQNHHLNEIIEDLFYPEMRMQDQQQIEMRVKQMASDSLLLGDDWEEELKADDLTQDIKGSYLPVDLLRLHQERWEEFTHKHYSVLMERMSYYCHNRARIQKKMMQNWERLVKKMQEKQGKNKPIKCPYLFLQREEITRHEQWGALTKQIHRKMGQVTDITAFNEYLPTLFQIQRTFNIVPADIYQLVFARNTLANFTNLTPDHISSLLRFLRYKNKVIYDPQIKISPEVQEEEASVSYLARKLASDIISHPQNYTKEDFMNIFIVVNSNKKKYNILTQQLLNKSQTIVSSIINELPFDKVLTYTVIYTLFHGKPNMDFLQILKFDLYRKCDAQTNYFPLLLLINRIHSRQLTFKNYPGVGQRPSVIYLEGYDLLLKATQSISKMISKLKPQQIISLLNSCYGNDLQGHTAIEIISTEFVKKGKEYDLQTLSKAFFKITLLGHRSKMLAKYVFEEYAKRYHDQVKKYKEEENLLLPTDANISAATVSNLKIVHLQQCLLICLWNVINQLGGALKSSLSLNELLTLIPVQLESNDPLAHQLANRINKQLTPYSFFPKIPNKPLLQSPQQSRLKEFYRHFQSQNQPSPQQKGGQQKKERVKYYDLFL